MFNVRGLGADRKANTTVLANSLSVVPTALSPASSGRVRLFSVVGYNSGPSQNIQVFDAAALPNNATVPEVNIPVPASSYFYEEFGGGIPYVLGLQICNSTTDVTKTIGAANCLILATYRIEQ